ncbi:MAG: single-stranded-DNA-specific exonuclease [bacterium]|jgi:single-stranded-DNA-specific exonuclease
MLPWKTNHWIGPKIPRENDTAIQLTRKLGLHPLTAQLLTGKGISNVDEAYHFLHPSSQSLHNPYLLKDMEKAVSCLVQAILNREKIMIFGDCDADGTCGTVLLYEYLKQVTSRACYFIPATNKDGYSLNSTTVAKILSSNINLIITVDNGSSANWGISELIDHGVKVIVTDHHLMGKTRPLATALINPQQMDCFYPFKMLSGAGVAFKLLCALTEELDKIGFWDIFQVERIEPLEFLDLVALATIADRCPLNGENRDLVKLGLEQINSYSRVGIASLIRAINIRTYITPSVISHRIAPKINAAGRLDKPNTAAKLLLAKNPREGFEYAKELLCLNKERQAIEKESFDYALKFANEDTEPVIIQMSEQFHPGTIGIVASRLCRSFGKPTILLSLSGNLGVGSARSSEEVNIRSLLEECSSLLEQYGGHASAAGLSLQHENFHQFKKMLIQTVQDKQIKSNLSEESLHQEDVIKYDAVLTPNDLSEKLADELLQMSPFGYQNPEPVLIVKGVKPNSPKIFSQKHIKFACESRNDAWEIFAWDHLDWYQSLQQKVEIAVSPQIYMKDNLPVMQLRMLDFKVAEAV